MIESPWVDLFVTLLIQAIGWAVLDFLIAFEHGSRRFLRSYTSSGTEFEIWIIGAIVGALAGMLTIPRQHRPWC